MNILRFKSILESGNLGQIDKEGLNIEEELKKASLVFHFYDPYDLKCDEFAELLVSREIIERMKQRNLDVNKDSFNLKAAW